MPPVITVLLVPASVRPFDAIKGISVLLRLIAVRVGDDFHQMTARIVEIDAAAAVQVIDLSGFGAPRIGVIPRAQRSDAGERRVELGVADEKRIMPRPEFL